MDHLVRDFLGARLRDLRLRRRLSQRILAKRVGVTPATIRNWELGHHPPRRVYLPTLADVLKVPVEFFTDEAVSDPGPPASFRDKRGAPLSYGSNLSATHPNPHAARVR